MKKVLEKKRSNRAIRALVLQIGRFYTKRRYVSYMYKYRHLA